jgi:hypothetical protein
MHKYLYSYPHTRKYATIKAKAAKGNKLTENQDDEANGVVLM